MVAEVAREAERRATPLTDEESQVLRAEWSKEIEQRTEIRDRLTELIYEIIKRESAHPPLSYKENTFCNAIEWAGDYGSPVVVELADRVFRGHAELVAAFPQTPWFRDKLQLLGCAVLLIVVPFLLFVIVALLSGK